MNPKFQATVLKLLKGDASKSKTFQKSTDDFRSGNVSPDNYIKNIESLFGADNVAVVVSPLIAELPERDASSKLKVAYDKYVSLKSKASKPSASPFGFFGSKKTEENDSAAAIAAIAAGAKKATNKK
jgi:3-deoxy-D-arabino-heptulosonate 7-phosphate (DAHP) synthase